MEPIELDWTDVMEVREAPADQSRWPVLYPFDLKFTEIGRASRGSALSGAGVYLISKGDEVVYVGSYRPSNGRIIADRWARHLETITGRGYRIGFAGKNSAKRRDALLAAVEAQSLKDAIEHAFEHLRERRFRDTGYCTTPNRLRFASENWPEFGVADGSQILRALEVRLFKISPADNAEAAAAEVRSIEKTVLARSKPICNKEYAHRRHAQDRPSNTVDRVSGAVRAAAIISTGNDIQQMVRVSTAG